MNGRRRVFGVAIGVAIAAVSMTGCAITRQETLPTTAVVDAMLPPPALPTIPVTEDAAPASASTAPPAPAASLAPVAAPRAARPLRTAIIVSDDIPEHAAIVAELLARDIDDVSVHDLAGRESNSERVIAEIEHADPDRLIAVGLLAARVARDVPDVPMVFCQVYNYPEHDLLSATSKGVSLLPPFSLQLRDWRLLAPELDRVGVITGPGQESLLAGIRAAAETAGVTLIVRTVGSDQEALIAFKELVPEIQGLSLLPDNRVLSPAIVGEIMAYGARHATQIAVFGESLLDSGALLSFRSDPGDVVDRVLAQLANAGADGALSGPDMLPLTMLRTTVNLAVAQQLGLAVPERLADSR